MFLVRAESAMAPQWLEDSGLSWSRHWMQILVNFSLNRVSSVSHHSEGWSVTLQSVRYRRVLLKATIFSSGLLPTPTPLEAAVLERTASQCRWKDGFRIDFYWLASSLVLGPEGRLCS